MTSERKLKGASATPSEVTPDAIAAVVPESDPAYPIIAAILRVVPASRWAFARPEPDGELGLLLESPEDSAGELSRLRSEYTRQREKAKTGPRIATTLGSLGDFESGITLLFADARATFGILTLLRTSELGPFTSSEIAVLTLALDGTSERLSTLRLNPPEKRLHNTPVLADPGEETAQPAEAGGSFYVLNRDLQIVLAWTTDDQRRIALTGLQTQLANRLPAVLEETVRELISGWESDPASQTPGFAHPVPFLVVRTRPMSGPAGLFIGVRIERFTPPNSLVSAGARYHISPRELQVLAQLLDGAKLDEIGKALNITTSTVQDHIRSMVAKTESRNRSELIARVLGWENASEARPG